MPQNKRPTLIQMNWIPGFKIMFTKFALFCRLFYAVQKYTGETVHNFVE